MDIYTMANKMRLERKTIFDLDIRVTFYARVSTTRDEQENSIENQIIYFTDLIKNNPHWTYIEGYVDRIRGENAANRTSFMQMINDGKSGKFDLILTKEVSRFARNTVDSLTYTHDLLRAGVGVFFQNDNICTIDTDSELRLTIMSSIAADEVRKLSDRVKWGQKRSIENGNVLGNNRIFGYNLVNKKLQINEQEAEMVRLIFELYATEKYSVRKIEKELYDRGYRGREGNRIHHNTISGIIQNPKYKGFYCGNKVKIIDFRTKQQRFLPPEEWIMYKDETGETVPALVSEEIWDKCNKIFKVRSEIARTKFKSIKNRSVLSGKLICTNDSRRYWRTSYSNSAEKGNSIFQWICSEKITHGAKTCNSFAIMESELYTMLGSYFQKVTPSVENYIGEFIEIYKQSEGSTITTIKSQISKLESSLLKEEQKRDKLLELCLDSTISKEEFQERNKSASITIAGIKQQIVDLQNKTQNPSEDLKELEEIKNFLQAAYTSENAMPKEIVDCLITTLIDRIDVTPIENDTMRLEIYLTTGLTQKYSLDKKRNKTVSSNCCSGIMPLLMLPEQQWEFPRVYIRRPATNRGTFIVYKVHANI